MDITNKLRIFITLIVVTTLTACTGKPDGIAAVENFKLDRYLGKWYEIARLDHSFERGLDNITAEYSLLEDGGVRVINSGYSNEDKEWEQAEGKAYFVDSNDSGHLKVSFFGPFYGSYIVFELDEEDYQYAFVSGPNTSYLWLLSRTPQVEQSIVDRFIQRSRESGFDTDELLFVEHDKKG